VFLIVLIVMSGEMKLKSLLLNYILYYMKNESKRFLLV